MVPAHIRFSPVPKKAHQGITTVGHKHRSPHRAFMDINKMPQTKPVEQTYPSPFYSIFDNLLQMDCKVFNYAVGPHVLVPKLFMYRAMPRPVVTLIRPHLTTLTRVQDAQRAMEEFSIQYTHRKSRSVFRSRNKTAAWTLVLRSLSIVLRELLNKKGQPNSRGENSW